MKVCTPCQLNFDDDARFCNHCGKELCAGPEPTGKDPAATPPPAEASPEALKGPDEPVAPAKTARPRKKTRSQPLVWVAIVVVSLIVILEAALLVIHLMQEPAPLPIPEARATPNVHGLNKCS